MDYPIELEQWWVDEARRQTGLSNLSAVLEAVRPSVARLSSLFTTERSASFGNYGNDEDLLLGYGLFFFPQTFVRVRMVLSEWTGLHGQPQAAGETFRVLDLGSGQGASSFAALIHLAEARPNRRVLLRAVDRSKPSLERLGRLFEDQQSLWPDAELETRVCGLEEAVGEAGDNWDLMIASFSLNEVSQDADDLEMQAWLQRALSRLSPAGTLVILEPVSEETSAALVRLRDWIASSGVARVLGPCPHRAGCSILRAARTRCHEVRKWRVPQSVAYINRTLQRTVHDLKFSFLMLGGAEAWGFEFGPGDFRMTAPMLKAPDRLITAGCAADGCVYDYEILTRNLSKARMKEMEKWERGSILRSERSSILGDGHTVRIEDTQRLFPPE
jgi:SAM-dependent methyltransferase